MVMAAVGRAVPLRVLREQLDPSQSGVSALALRDGGRRYGVVGRAVRVRAWRPGEVPVPFVAPWDGDHFVVVERVGRKVTVLDPAAGRRCLSRREVAGRWSGIALIYRAVEEPGQPLPPPDAPPQRMVIGILSRHKGPLAIVAALSLLLTGMGLAVPLATARVVDALSHAVGAAVGAGAGAGAGGGNGQPAPWLWFGLLVPMVAALSLGRGLVVVWLQRRLGLELPRTIVSRLLAAPFSFTQRRGSGELLTRVGSMDAVRDALSVWLLSAVIDALLSVGYLVVIASVDPVFGCVPVAVAVVLLVPSLWLGSLSRRLHAEELIRHGESRTVLMETLSALDAVKVAGAELQALQRWDAAYQPALGVTVRRARIAAVAGAALSVAQGAAPVLFISFAGQRAAGGHLGLGTAVGLAALATTALGSLVALTHHLGTAYELAGTLDYLADALDAPVEQAADLPLAPTLRGSIQLRGVRFRYYEGAPWVLDGVDLDIPAGAKVAVVGPSGSGKSTLVNLLVSLYRPTEGSVRYDGIDLADVDLASVRRQIGVVPQDPKLFTGTVRENIVLARRDADQADVVAAARLAAVHDDIRALQLGYDTRLAVNGGGLSGGQRQRLALARALIGHPAILLLDEATSHLDAATEAAVERGLRSLRMTRIVVAHRLTTVRDADLVVVVSGGSVVESGPPGTLLRRGGHYAQLVAVAEGREDATTGVVGWEGRRRGPAWR